MALIDVHYVLLDVFDSFRYFTVIDSGFVEMENPAA